jgi:hypothetical protein
MTKNEPRWIVPPRRVSFPLRALATDGLERDHRSPIFTDSGVMRGTNHRFYTLRLAVVDNPWTK